MKHAIPYLAALLFAMTTVLARAEELPCSKSEAFGQTFGSKRIKAQAGSAGPRNVLAKAWGEPYQPQLVDLTVKSREVFSVWGTAAFADADTALKYAERLIEGFRVALPAEDIETKAPGVAILYTSRAGFTEKLGGKDVFFHTEGLKVDIEATGNVVYVSCSDFAGHGKHIAEAMAK